MKTVFLRVLEAEDKAVALRAAIYDQEAARGKQRFEIDVASFSAVPRSPFAYWVSRRVDLVGCWRGFRPVRRAARDKSVA